VTPALDHVLLAVPDLDAAGAALAARHGLPSAPGGSHPGFGTANRIVPLGPAYLELVAVSDPARAAAGAFGRWVASSPPSRPMGWAVRTAGLDGVARRLGLDVRPGSREVADGTLLRWRMAGVEAAAAEPFLPFFIEWGAGTPFPGGGDGPGIERLVVRGDAARLRGWLGGADLPLEVRPGPAAVLEIVVGGGIGPIARLDHRAR
jgi:Glyoxalase-like domain